MNFLSSVIEFKKWKRVQAASYENYIHFLGILNTNSKTEAFTFNLNRKKVSKYDINLFFKKRRENKANAKYDFQK